MTHEKSIACVGGGGRIVIGGTRAVHLAENGDAAAIIHVIDESRTPGVDGSKQDEGAFEADAAAGIARRQLEIDDALVRGGIRIETEFRHSPDFLICAGIFEGHT
jgi:hypothetical protein